MTTTLCNNISVNDNQYYSISCSNNCGQFIFNVDEQLFTEDMKRQLSGIHIKLYNYQDGEYIPILNRSILYNTNQDASMVIYDIPDSFYVRIIPIIDEEVIKYYKIQKCEEFPIKLQFDDADISSSNNGVQSITINGKEVTPDENKVVNISVPVKVSELVNDQVLRYTDVEVKTTDFVESTTLPDYPFKADISLENVTETDYANVVFSIADVQSMNFASICTTSNGIVTIYAKELPQENTTIPLIEVVKV